MRQDALHRKQRILTEARRLFAEHGSEISLDTVAEASGVGIATLYRNFPARDQLIFAVALEIIGEIDQALTRAREQLPANPQLAWERLIGQLVQLNLGALTEALGGTRWAQAPEELTGAQANALGRFTELLEQLRAARIVRQDLDAFEVIASLGVLTRPQPEPIARAVPNLSEHLMQAFLLFSRPANG